MALPATGYDLESFPAPSSDITDYSPIIDHANDSANYISDINTTDGTRGRIALHSSGAELAKDPIDFVNSSNRGLTRFYYGTVLAASSEASRQIRKYPPNTRNAAYAASDTYGSENAYDSNIDGYWPLVDDGNDRTSNGNDGTPVSVTIGDTAGQIGNATTFDGTPADYVNMGAVIDRAYDDTYGMGAWINCGTVTGDNFIMTRQEEAPDFNGYVLSYDGTNINAGFIVDFSPANWFLCNATYGFSSGWHHVRFQKTGANTGQIYVDGSAVTTNVTQNSLSSTPSWTGVDFNMGSRLSGSGADGFDGAMQHGFSESGNRSTAWIEHEYDQTDDNATFWGTWAWTSPGGTTYNNTISESAGFTDTVSYSLDFGASISESIGLADTNSLIIDFVSSIAEDIGLTDNISTAQEISIAITESTGVTDTISTTHTLTISVDESTSFEDTVAGIADYAISLMEEIGLTDTNRSGALINGRMCVTITGARPQITITGSKPEISLSGSRPFITITGEGC